MSVSTGARRGTPEERRISESLIKNEQDLIQRMKPFPTQIAGLGPASSGQGSSSAPGHDFLEDVGAQLQGAIGYVQNVLPLDVDNAIHLLRDNIDAVFTSFGEMTDTVADSRLDLIDGGDFSGQILKLRIPDSVTSMVVNNANRAGNAGNILMPGIENLIVGGGEILEFIYDTFTLPSAEVQARLSAAPIAGMWRLTGGSSIPTAEPALNISRLSADQPTAGVVAWDLNFILGDDTRIIDSATDGVFEIIDGVFSLESVLALQMLESGAGSVAACAWESSATEGGVYTTIANNTTVLATYATGRPEFTTQPHATVVVDATGTSLFVRCFLTEQQQGLTGGGILNLASFAAIEFLTPGGAGGRAGGGATRLDQLTDVFINPDPPTVDGLVLTWDLADGRWEAIAPGASTGATRELDNLTTTALNTDIHMNTFDIDQLDRLIFQPSSNTIDGTLPGIFADLSANMTFNVDDQKQYFWNMNNNARMQLDQSGVDNDTILTVQTDISDISGKPEIVILRDDPTPQTGLASDSEVGTLSLIGTNAATNGGAKVGNNVYSKITSIYENVITGREAASLNFFTAFDTGVDSSLKPFM